MTIIIDHEKLKRVSYEGQECLAHVSGNTLSDVGPKNPRDYVAEAIQGTLGTTQLSDGASFSTRNLNAKEATALRRAVEDLAEAEENAHRILLLKVYRDEL